MIEVERYIVAEVQFSETSSKFGRWSDVSNRHSANVQRVSMNGVAPLRRIGRETCGRGGVVEVEGRDCKRNPVVIPSTITSASNHDEGMVVCSIDPIPNIHSVR